MLFLLWLHFVKCIILINHHRTGDQGPDRKVYLELFTLLVDFIEVE